MKNLSKSLQLVFIILCCHPTHLFSQIKMGDNPLIINPAAIFEIESKEQGVLLPRMSSQERDEISFPELPNGLLIYNTDLDGFEYYSVTKQGWISLSVPYPQLTLNENRLSLSTENSIDLSLYLDNSDSQKLTLEGNILKLESGGSVDLTPLLDKNSTQQLSLVGTELFLENGGSVNLSSLYSANTDKQKIDQFELVSNTLFLSIENDEQNPLEVILPVTNTDEQKISLSESILELERGGAVDLSPFKDNKDEQQLNLTLVNSQTASLKISNGNTIQWTTNDSLGFSMTSSNVMHIESQQSPLILENEVISNHNSNWINEDFVIGSDRLDNDPSITLDNKRMFFSKASGAFRVGLAQSDQWDSKNVGTYSIAMGRNTIASGFNATAFGISTKASAWYATTFGQGTEASSRSEMVIGSYNSLKTSLGGTRDWHPLDRLFVIGNSTGSTTASRTDALVMLKDGSTLLSGIWTGPGFTIVSDKRVKSNISKLNHGVETLQKITSYSYELNTNKTKKRFGFMADEIEKILPELVSINTSKNELKSIDYIGLIPVLVNAIVEQQKEIDQLKKEMKKR